MQQSVDAMRVGLRVLAALTERRQPLSEDVEQLRRLAPPLMYQSVDEMACAVVEDSIKRHRANRDAAGV